MTKETIQAKASAIIPALKKPLTLLALWSLLALVAGITKLHSCNNFHIFRGAFWHAAQQLPLYEAYPDEYFDIYHYGPVFSLVIAPFAVMPLWFGVPLWCLSMTLLLYLAVRLLPTPEGTQSARMSGQQLFIFWFCAHELLTALFMQQFNVVIAAVILLCYALIERQREGTAAFFLVLGTLTKLYGIVGLAFFFFSRHKLRFVLWTLLWTAVMFVAPMVLSSPEYVVGQYQAWFYDLVGKNAENGDSIAQNISLLGMAHRISGQQFSDLWLILPGMALFALPYLRLASNWLMRRLGRLDEADSLNLPAYRQMLLASVLMFVCLFSTGTESSGYIIALTGVVIWYTAAPWQRSRWDVALMVFAFILTSLSPSDLFPRYVKQEIVQPYALKALPVALIWFKLCGEVMFRTFRVKSYVENTPQ